MSPQNYYKSRKVRERKSVDAKLVKDLVDDARSRQPRLGGLKLHYMLRDELSSAGVTLGRDRFFDVLRSQALLLEPLPKSPRTTNSSHNLPVYPNLVKEIVLTGPNQVWISDITYIRTEKGFVYLSLISDKYSRKIVGHCLGDSLSTTHTLKALKMALKKLPEGCHPVHHSDRGTQYCSKNYIKMLKKRGLEISMTEVNHCAENAQAERVNGILKQEYYLNHTFKDIKQARIAVSESVELYNTLRPHRALEMLVPEAVHKKVAA